jgi:ABC-type multidrug transport system ATPase subunit
MTAIVEARRLQKTYGKIRALEDVSFSIETGEIFGLLGPNGAGKTTTLRMLSGLAVPDGGQAVVECCDVIRNPVGTKKRL